MWQKSKTNSLEYKHVFSKVNSPAVSEGAVGVGESAEGEVVAGMVPEGTTSDVTATACAKNCVTQ